MAREELSKDWERFRSEIGTRRTRFAQEWESAWRELSALLHRQMAAEPPAPPLEAGRVATLRGLIHGPGQALLFDAVAALRRTRPQERALAALEDYRAACEDLAVRLPESCLISAKDWAEVLGLGSGKHLLRHLFRRGHARTIHIRRIAQQCLLDDANLQAAWQGAYFAMLARATLVVLWPWQDLRREWLRILAAQPMEADAIAANRALRLRTAEALQQQGTKLLGQLHSWGEGATARLAQGLLRGKLHSTRSLRGLAARREHCYRFWSRQHRAIRSVWELEFEAGRLTIQVTDDAEGVLASLDREHSQLLEELDSVNAWLERAQTDEQGSDFPPPAVQLASADDRTSEWERLAEAAGRIRLPLSAEIIEPKYSLPPRRSPWRVLEAQGAFLTGITHFGLPKVQEAFRGAEAGHRAIVREIERAREVVAFSREAAAAELASAGSQAGGSADTAPARESIVREGLTNARALLTFQRENAIDPRPLTEQKVVEGVASVLLYTQLTLERRRLGALKQLVRASGSSTALEVSRLAAEKTSAAGLGLRRMANRRYHDLLRRIGWEEMPVTPTHPVEARPQFNEILDLQLGTHDLPAIYRRLFRLAPLEEPRFLVGRETEMMALTRARELWQQQRAGAVILVGARGSGKTSLLNCASAVAFAGVPIVRGQFQDRITKPAEMRRFLHRLFELPDEESLEGFLRHHRPVVMLEELERAFLRAMHGFDGMRELLSVVSATAQSALWIFSLNQRSFRYLEAAVGVGQYFSQQINATAVSKEHMKNAILMRHYLSGLRLQYPPAPRLDPRVTRAQRLLGLARSAEEVFFDSLYVQSEGVFRSAFELWQHYIERVEGGVLYLREPAEPEFGPMFAPLLLDDAFSLQAILQHGNLTFEEHAAVFDCSVPESRRRLEKLQALELLEREPGGPGWRIRPEAGRIVHVALHRRNLG